MKTIVPADYETMIDTAWSRLHDAADNPSHPMRLLTVASIDDNGEPDARLLVLRGANRDLERLWFHTDRRSRKVIQFQENPRSCAVCYDGRDGVQLRLWGLMSMHLHDELARRIWEQTDFAVRHSYGLTATPGQPLPHPDPRFEAQRKHVVTGSEEAGRENFMVLELRVHLIEWFQTTPLGDRRAIMRAVDAWEVVPLVP